MFLEDWNNNNSKKFYFWLLEKAFTKYCVYNKTYPAPSPAHPKILFHPKSPANKVSTPSTKGPKKEKKTLT
jgi:hypothetical protein